MELPTIATILGLQMYKIATGTLMHIWRIRKRLCIIVNWTMNEWTFCIKMWLHMEDSSFQPSVLVEWILHLVMYQLFEIVLIINCCIELILYLSFPCLQVLWTSNVLIYFGPFIVLVCRNELPTSNTHVPNYLQSYASIWNLNFKLQLWRKFKSLAH